MTQSNKIDFYFDLSSPYGYFAAEQIQTLAAKHNATTNWHPFLLGAVFKVTGRSPLVNQSALVADYSKHDMLRSARRHNLPLKIPSKFPIMSVAPCRAYYWLAQTDPEAAKQLALAFYRAYFLQDIDISNQEQLLNIIKAQGHDPKSAQEGMADQSIKDQLRQETDQAIARGVFGSPFILIGEEPFWGNDKLPEIDAWLSRSW